MEALGGLLVILGVCALYFLPTLVASARHHHNAEAICAVNLFLGWTLVGWVVSLSWALTVVKPPPA